MKNQKNSKAFSLLEIVISVVVLGIIATTFPFILSNIKDTAKDVMKEETLLNEMSLITLILPYYFDENNTGNEDYYKDLNASNGDSELLINSSSMYTGSARIGKAQFNNNELRSGSELDVSDIGIDKDENKSDILTYDDIDDFDDYNQTRHNVTFFVEVYYIDDNTDYSDSVINFKLDYNTKKIILI
jgi:prepilin-type N-terminal cleavage/methylation domain-containing protein